jgi:ABC-type multidrug transport system ATPase subunit
MTVSSAILLDRNADSAPALMEVAGLAKRYGEQRALADISFAVNAGEVLGLIGPNGAGKTTLMEAVAGVLAADDGRILWRGTPLALPQRREFMFYLPDGLRPWEDQYAARVIESSSRKRSDCSASRRSCASASPHCRRAMAAGSCWRWLC